MSIADVSGKSITQLISLEGRRAVVTGGAQGLGNAIARRLAEAGAAVLIGDLKAEKAQAAGESLAQTYGISAIGMAMDVSQEASVEAVADRAVQELGGIDIWVSNAGLYPFLRLKDHDVDTWDAVMSVNLRGVFLGARAASRRMIAAGRGGVIVNVASTAGFRGISPGLAAYVTSKHGVRGMTKQLALELAPHDIRVLGVAPTYCETEGNLEAAAENVAAGIDMSKEIPVTAGSRLGRVGVADDIGRVALFCASDMAMFMTGSTLLVDAGETI
jgi:NAD(P)-dependent dehydrogenase (short-subunit alcohol dehydrogenase family)